MSALDGVIAIGRFIYNKLWVLGLLLFIYIFVYSPLTIPKKEEKFKNVPCVTIAHTNGVTGGRLTYIKYSYFVNGVEYHGQDGSGFNFVKTEEGKYLIKYMCDDPQDALIYFDKPIKGDTIPVEYLK